MSNAGHAQGFIKSIDRAFDRRRIQQQMDDDWIDIVDAEDLKEELLRLVKNEMDLQWQHGFNCGDVWRLNLRRAEGDKIPTPNIEDAAAAKRRRDTEEFVAGWNATAGKSRCQVIESP